MLEFIQVLNWQFVALITVLFLGSIVGYFLIMIRKDSTESDKFRRTIELEKFRSENAKTIEKRIY